MQAHALDLDTSHDTQRELERWAGVAMATAVMAFGLSRRSVPGACIEVVMKPGAERVVAAGL